METRDYCPICAENIVFQIPELEHSCIDADAVDAAEFQVLAEEASSTNPVLEPVNQREALVKLRTIWANQLATREDRVVHGRFEGNLAHHLMPIVSHLQSKPA
jgi:hypothetical protein